MTLAAVILSEIGDISRFPDPKQLTAFAGLDPVLKQSGMNKGLGYHMSKRGSPYLRRALWLAANSIKKWDPSFAYAYQKNLILVRTKVRLSVLFLTNSSMLSSLFSKTILITFLFFLLTLTSQNLLKKQLNLYHLIDIS